MKKTIKHYLKYCGFILVLAATILFGCRCSTSKQDPLVGFHRADEANMDKNKAITDDYKSYIQKLTPDEKTYLGPILYYEDRQGQHAVTFEVDKHGKDVWDHYLFYDKSDNRIKAVKYYRGRYWNP